MARVRVHQHVNPLSPHYRREPSPIELKEIFGDAELPLFLDIGCARGRFLLRMAQAEPGWNYLGIEIREPLVEEANRIAADAGLKNLHYTFCNAMLWLGRLIAEIPNGQLQMAAIQFPDPWFKKKHAKRRMVSAGLVSSIVEKLEIDGKIFVQTDIAFLAEEMFDLFRSNKLMQETEVIANPLPVKTEREIAVEGKELPVYRGMWRKLITSSSSLS
jgi:tRNA (guanine-N7-)-methyltransferase